jgi:hypothetical protein
MGWDTGRNLWDELVRCGGFLQQVAARAGLEGAKHITFVGVHTQDDDRDSGLPGTDLARSLDAIHVGHGDIQHGNVRFEGLREGHRLPPIAGLADHLEVLLFLKNQTPPASGKRIDRTAPLPGFD